MNFNALAAEVETNTRCLLKSFEQTRTLLEKETFNHSEAWAVQDLRCVFGCLASWRMDPATVATCVSRFFCAETRGNKPTQARAIGGAGAAGARYRVLARATGTQQSVIAPQRTARVSLSDDLGVSE
jgi:hypothetical protein